MTHDLQELVRSVRLPQPHVMSTLPNCDTMFYVSVTDAAELLAEIESLQGQVADMSLVIYRLRQFTDRFPTTQDGHPVAGGDTVYCKLGGVIEPVTIPHPPRQGVYTGCFHTYEAALAAPAAGGE